MGLGTLMSLYTSARTSGCEMQLLNIGKRVRELLGLTNLLSVFASSENTASGSELVLFHRVDSAQIRTDPQSHYRVFVISGPRISCALGAGSTGTPASRSSRRCSRSYSDSR